MTIFIKDNDAVIQCACYSKEHILWIEYDNDIKMWYIASNLEHRFSWYRRIWIAIKYIFNYTDNQYKYTVTCINDNEMKELVEFINSKNNESV